MNIAWSWMYETKIGSLLLDGRRKIEAEGERESTAT